MKNTIKLIGMLYICASILTNSLIAQDREPKEPYKFQYRYKNDDGQWALSNNEPLLPSRFQQKEFLLSWHWGAFPKQSESLGMTADMGSEKHDYFIENTYSFRPTVKKLDAIIGAYSINLPWYAQSFQYEPTLEKLDKQEGEVFVRNESVPAIFGFKSINNKAIQIFIPDIDVTDKNKYLLKLDYTNFQAGDFNDDLCLILSNNWPNDNFRAFFTWGTVKNSYDKGNTTIDEESFIPTNQNWDYKDRYLKFPVDEEYQYGGAEWFLTLNLRKSGTGTGRSDKKVLKLIVKSKTHDIAQNLQYHDIKFEALPRVDIPEINVNHFLNGVDGIDDRGKTLELAPVTGEPVTEFVVTEDMLDKVSSGNFITLSARFNTKARKDELDNTLPNDNPMVKLTDGQITSDIPGYLETFEIEVYYYKEACGVEIDWIRLENTIAKNLFAGMYDGQTESDYSVTKPEYSLNHLDHPEIMTSLKNKFQEYINMTTSNTSSPSEVHNFFRVHTESSDDGLFFYNWGAIRYLNKAFLNGLGTNAQGMAYPELYYYYVGSVDRWVGCHKYYDDFGGASPYFLPNFSGYPPDHFKVQITNNFDKMNGLKGNYVFWNSQPACHPDKKEVFNSVYETWILGPGCAWPCYDEADHYPYGKNWENLIRLIREDDGNTKTLSECIGGFISGLQAKWEYQQGGGSINVFSDNPEFLYRDEQLWWGQAFVDHRYSIYKYNDRYKVKGSLMKPLTGEEIALMDWSIILKGGKGLIYDGAGAVKYINKFISKDDNNQYVYNYADADSRVTSLDNYMKKNLITEIVDQVNDLFVSPLLDNDRPFDNEDGQYLTENGINYWEYIKRDALGVDFASIPDTPETYFTPSLYDSTYIGLFIPNKSEVINYLGFGDRYYMGLKSRRIALKKIHDWCNENSNLLMSLRLRAWYGKGFFIKYNQKMNNDNYYNENGLIKLKGDLLRNYVKLPSEQDWFTGDINKVPVKVRPIDRMKDNKPYYLPPDSTFYDITLLKQVEKDQNNNYVEKPNIFFLGVQSRCTDPLIITEDCSDPTDEKHYCVDFYSTGEFDKNVVTGGNDLSGTMRDKAWWQSKWWKRLGCREITIPLNLGPEHRNKLIKVTEIARSITSIQAQHEYNSTTLSENEINELYPTVNKVIGYDGTITAKFLPGEGKLFKCEILDLKDPIIGNLAHSNQTKLIAFPEFNEQGNETGDIRFHVVYFKEDKNDNRIKVFYNRSQKINANTENPQIEWDDQVGRIVSNDFFYNNDGPINANECDYPSIVIRKNNNKLTAYIAYTCSNPASNTSSYVNVTSFDITDLNYKDKAIDLIPGSVDNITRRNDGIALITSENREEWGNPVINANSIGNFYIFSDPLIIKPPDPSQSGLQVFFGGPSEIPVHKLDIFTPSFSGWDIPVTPEVKHPSVNTYSFSTDYYLTSITSLAWQSNYKNPNTNAVVSKIIFTKIQCYDNTMYFVLSDNDLPENDNIIRQNTDTYPEGILKKFRMLDGFSYLANSSFPVIYSRNDGGSVNDYIYYENHYLLSPLTWLKGFSFNKISSNPLSISYSEGITDNNRYTGQVMQPNISQPGQFNPFTYNIYSWYNINSDFNLNMLINGNIYHYLGTSKNLNYFTSNYSAARLVALNSNQSHLAQMPSNNLLKPWKNRRVFNDADNNILTTATYFYDISPEDLIGENQIGFNADTASLFLGLPKLNNEFLPIERPVIPIYEGTDSAFVMIPKDTLWTNWFKITTDTIEIKVTGIDTAAKFILKYADNYMITLSLPGTLKLDTGRVIKYCFYNGNGMDYKFAMIRTDTLSSFTENTIIGGIPVLDTVYYSYNLERPIVRSVPNDKVAGKEIILEVTPVPAKDIVYVSARLPEGIKINNKTDEINLKLISFDGKDLLTIPANSGVTKSISLEKFAQGIYFIRAEAGDLLLKESVLPAVRQIVIER